MAPSHEGATKTSSTVSITVSSSCTASGTITRDYWEGVRGNTVSEIPINKTPTSTTELTIFEGPSNVGTNYGARIRGYICPPVTGDYTFYVSSNDHSELWISTDDDPSNKFLIAYVAGATNPRQWDKFASQRSTPVHLVEGNRYYIEALHKQGVGTDHIAVGWRWPNLTLERPIPGHHLSPFETNSVRMVSGDDQNSESTALYSQINVYPNPLQSGDRELTIAGYAGIDETIDTQVEIINLAGDVIFRTTFNPPGR